MAKGPCFGFPHPPELLPGTLVIETRPWNGFFGLTTTARKRFWAMQTDAEGRAASIFGIAAVGAAIPNMTWRPAVSPLQTTPKGV